MKKILVMCCLFSIAHMNGSELSREDDILSCDGESNIVLSSGQQEPFEIIYQSSERKLHEIIDESNDRTGNYSCNGVLFPPKDIMFRCYDNAAIIDGEPVVWNHIRLLVNIEKRALVHEKKRIKAIIDNSSFDSLNGKNNKEETLISSLILLPYSSNPEYIHHILEMLFEFGVNPCDKTTLSWVNKNDRVKQEYLPLMSKWKEECKNCAAFQAFEDEHYITPIKEGGTPTFDEKILQCIRKHTYKWDVSKLLRVWSAVTNPVIKNA